MADFQFGLEVDLVIILRPRPVAVLRPILAHHDDRRLERGEAGTNQVREDKWVRIEGPGSEDDAIDDDPDPEDRAKKDDERPAAAEGGDPIGKSFPQTQLLFEFLPDVLGKNFMLLQAIDHFLIERS